MPHFHDPALVSPGDTTHRTIERWGADTLWWSRKGDVACRDHAPVRDSEEWFAEGWRLIPDELRVHRRRAYQCPHCAQDGRRLAASPQDYDTSEQSG